MASRLETAVTGGAPNLLGSLTAASRPLAEDADWRAFGVSHVPENCGHAWPFQQCTDGAEVDKPMMDGAAAVTFLPFLAEYNASSCGGVVGADLGRLEGRAQRGLSVRTSNVIAQMLSSSTPDGTQNASPNLPDAATDVTSAAGAVGLACTVGRLLEAAHAAGMTGEAFIHAPAWTLPHWLEARLLTQVGNVWKMGPHTVVLDQGFHNEAPTGVAEVEDPEDAVAGPAPAEGEAWLYVSGPVEFATTPIEALTDTSRGLNTRQNTGNAIAAQLAIYRFDPCGVQAALAVVCAYPEA